MAGFITMPQALQIIGQAPVKHGTKTATEKLRAAKSTFPMFGGGGGMTDMLQKMMKDGPGAMLSNPMSAISGALGGQLSGMAGKLTGMLSGGGLAGLANAGGLSSLVSQISGAGGLQSALSSLTGTAASLSGLSGGTGQFDLQSVMGHGGLSSLGVNLPASVGLDKVLGPVFSGGHMSNIGSTLSGMLPGVLAGGDPSAMIQKVGQFTVQTMGIISDSNNALLSGQNLTMAAAHLSAVSAEMMDGPTGVMKDFLDAIVNPDAKAAIQEHQAQLEAMFARNKAAP